MDIFLQALILIIFGGACWAFGDFLLGIFLPSRTPFSPGGRWSLSFALGNVAFSYLLMALGFAQLYRLWILWLIFLGGAGLLIYRIYGKLRERGPSSQTQGGDHADRRAFVILLGALIIFYLPTLLQAAAPPYARDSLVYHLLCPKEYLAQGRIHYIPGNLYSAFPKGNEVILTLLLGVAGDRAAQGFSIFQQMAAIGALHCLTRMFARPWVALFSTLGYATVPPVVYFSGCAYVEPALLMALGSSFLLLFFSQDFQKIDRYTQRN